MGDILQILQKSAERKILDYKLDSGGSPAGLSLTLHESGKRFSNQSKDRVGERES
jgi:hypothetical protein